MRWSCMRVAMGVVEFWRGSQKAEEERGILAAAVMIECPAESMTTEGEFVGDAVDGSPVMIETRAEVSAASSA